MADISRNDRRPALDRGRYRRLIKIQRRDITARDAAGQPTGAWVDVTGAWANILHQSGIEVVRNGTKSSIVQCSIRIPYREGLDASMRVVRGSTIYDIQAVMPDDAGHEYVDLVCTTGASRG